MVGQMQDAERWDGLSLKPSLVHTSTDNGWSSGQFHEVYFSGRSSFDYVNVDLALSYVPNLRFRLSGQRFFQDLPRKIGISLPDDGYAGEGEGSSAGHFLFIKRDVVEAFTNTEIKQLMLGPSVYTSAGTRFIESRQIEYIMSLIRNDVALSSPDGPLLGDQLIVRILEHLFPRSRSIVPAINSNRRDPKDQRFYRCSFS